MIKKCISVNVEINSSQNILIALCKIQKDLIFRQKLQSKYLFHRMKVYSVGKNEVWENVDKKFSEFDLS